MLSPSARHSRQLQTLCKQAALQAKDKLQEVQDLVNGLKKKYDDSMASKKKLQNEAEQMEILDRAEQLVGGLAGERDRGSSRLRTLGRHGSR